MCGSLHKKPLTGDLAIVISTTVGGGCTALLYELDQGGDFTEALSSVCK